MRTNHYWLLLAATALLACDPKPPSATQPPAATNADAASGSPPADEEVADVGTAEQKPEAAPKLPGPEADQPTPGELNPERREVFWGSAQDPGADVLLGNTKELIGKHYVAGNEKRMYTFAEHIADLGGGYVGVGTDQAYFMVGWMKPEYAWFVDYDPVVVDVHQIYEAFLAHAKTPEEFMLLWQRDSKDDALAVIDAGVEEEARQRCRDIYLAHRGWIERRLDGFGKRLRKAKVPSFVDDQTQYDWVRTAVANGRTRPMLANLLEEGAIRDLGRAARELQVPIRVLYLSNAEEYWDEYTDVFRANVRGLPFHDDALILRTLLTWDVNQDYRYNVQPARNFLEWLERPWLRSVREIAPLPRKPQEAVVDGVLKTLTDQPPDESAAARRAKQRPNSQEPARP